MGGPSTTQARANSAWQRRLRRLFWFVGAAGTFYYISSYALGRMREARMRAVRDRKQRELIKSHFTSLMSTISFTLYALLPTLEPQISEAFPVEATSLALQGLTATRPGQQPELTTSAENSANASAAESDGVNSSRASEVAETPEGSVVISRGPTGTEYQDNTGHVDGIHTSPGIQLSIEGQQHLRDSEPSTSQSWASEFESSTSSAQGHEGMSDSGVLSMGQPETEDGLASAISQATSLPTDIDISNFSGSPPSDLSTSILHSPSPPRAHYEQSQARSSRSPTQSPVVPGRSVHLPPTVPPPAPASVVNHWPDLLGKSKKELWRDLKTASISRAITTAILIPLLHLLTVSQLSTLARRRYLEDVASSLPNPKYPQLGGASADRKDDDMTTRQKERRSRGGWLHSFSIEGMGLSDLVEESASLLPSSSSLNPLAYVPTAVTSRLPVPAFLRPATSHVSQTPGPADDWTQEYEESGRLHREQEQAEAERMYLTYSWWILHEGWRSVKEKVDEEVERVFGSMPLKRELRAEDWEALINEIVLAVLGDENAASNLSIPHTLLPPTPLPDLPDCPLPLTPSSSPSLLALLNETRTHLASPDAHYLVSRGVESMTRRLVILIKEEVYGIPEFAVLGAGAQVQSMEGSHAARGRRLVDCLPALGKWGKDTWAEVPDAGVEGVLGGLEGEGMAGLIFGDWAGR